MSAPVIHRSKQEKPPSGRKGIRRVAGPTAPAVQVTAAANEEPAFDLGNLLRSIQELGDYDQQKLTICVDVLGRNKGCVTPVENFLVDLLWRYGASGGALEPKDVDSSLEQFREDFADIISVASRISRTFPALMNHADGGHTDAA